jgi:tetratricopeptide (TPR) repeat protein
MKKFLLLSCFTFSLSFAQTKKMDSLLVLYHSAADSAKARLIFELMEACEVKDNLKYGQLALDLIDKKLSEKNDAKETRRLLKAKAYTYDILALYYIREKQDGEKWFDYQKKRLAIYEQINDTTNTYILYIKISSNYRVNGDLPQALELLQKGLHKSEELKDKRGIMACLSELGDMYNDQGDSTQAKLLYDKMLRIGYELNDKKFLAETFMKIGGLYNAIGNYNTALAYYARGMELFTETKHTGGRMEIYKNKAHTFNQKKDYDSSIANFQNAIAIAEAMKKPVAVADFMGQMANVYANKKDYTSAIATIDKAIKYNQDNPEYGDMKSWLQSKLAKIYWQKKDYRTAKYHSDKNVKILKSNGIDIARDYEELAAKIDSACGEYKTAYLHYQNYVALRDRSKSEEVSKAATKEKFQSDYKKQKEIDQAEQDKKDLLAREEMQRQKVVRNSFIGGFALLLILAGVIFRSYRQKQKANIELEKKNAEIAEQKHLIEEKQEEVMASIKYAKRIQMAQIPSEKMISVILKKLKS